MLRVASDSSIYFPVVLVPVREYVRYAALRDFRDYALAGAGGGILLLALVSGWILRSQLFGLLAILVAGFLGYYLIFNGYYQWFGGPFAGWVNRQFMLAECAGIEILGCWQTIRAAEKATLDLHPDILFLDVQIPGGGGFGLLQRLEMPPMVISGRCMNWYR